MSKKTSWRFDKGKIDCFIQIEIPISRYKKEKIFIHSNTNPNKFAYEFSKTHNLNYETHQEVLKTIQSIFNSDAPIKTESNTKKKKKKLIQSKSAKNTLNNTIYKRKLEYQYKTKQKLSELKNQLELSDEEINTFFPRVNPITSKAFNYRVNNNIQYNNSNRILNYKSYLNEKIEKLREKHYNYGQEKYFRPTINKSYMKTSSNKQTVNSNTLSRYDELYLDYKKRKENLNKIITKTKDDYTFKPLINSGKNEIVLKKDNSDPYLRLYNYAKKYKANKEERYNSTIYNNIDYHVYTSEQSNIIINSKKEDIFKQIFKLLDGDEDGIISRIYVDTRKVPKNVMKLINPIINELKCENETLNEREFVIACSHLFNMMSLSEKNLLLNIKLDKNTKKLKSPKKSINFEYKPIVNYIPLKIEKYRDFVAKNNVNGTIMNNN